jgi:uncharacterized membrane protein (DUF4010 family)
MQDSSTWPTAIWPYVPTMARLMLALAVGLFVGIERERRRKEAGLRTFAFVGLMGALGSLMGSSFALLALGLVGVLIVLLNFDTIRNGAGAEITTSAALIAVTFSGVLAGQGQLLIAGSLGVLTAALLAWKEPLAGFSHTLTDTELRSAVLLAILAIVIYPVLPEGHVGPGHLIDPRTVWIAVLLVAGLGFINYILLRVYGPHAIELTGLLGGLVNSTVTVTELANRARDSNGSLAPLTFRGIVITTAAMLLRNSLILGILAPRALLKALLPMGVMFAGAAGIALVHYWRSRRRNADKASISGLQSPFSLSEALKFGLMFLLLTVAGNLAQRWLGAGGFFAVTILGGLVSSATTVASAATLAAAGDLSPQVAGLGAVFASLASTAIHFPLAARGVRDRALVRKLGYALGSIFLLGLGGVFLTTLLA